MYYINVACTTNINNLSVVLREDFCFHFVIIRERVIYLWLRFTVDCTTNIWYYIACYVACTTFIQNVIIIIVLVLMHVDPSDSLFSFASTPNKIKYYGTYLYIESDMIKMCLDQDVCLQFFSPFIFHNFLKLVKTRRYLNAHVQRYFTR